MRGTKLPVKKTKVFEADVTLKKVIVNVRALDREEATREAREMFWEQLAKEKVRPQVGIVLRRLL